MISLSRFSLNKVSIAKKLPLMIVGGGTLVGICLGLAAYWSAASTLEHEAEAKLETILEARLTGVERYLASLEEDIRFIASSPTARLALNNFDRAWDKLEGDPSAILQRLYIEDNPHPTGSKEELHEADDGSAYSKIHGNYHPWFRQFLRERGYYDISLFDRDGNLVYTVFKELDYATNLVSGQYRDTDLGNAFRSALDGAPGELVFLDFKPYAPSHGAPASFIATQVTGNNGRPIGVLAFQMPIDRINFMTQIGDRLGATAQMYLVGADRLMRSDSRFADESTILAKKISTPAVDRAFAGERGSVHVFDERGEEMITAFAPVDFNGSRWAFVAEVARNEVMAPAHALAWKIFGVTAAILVLLAAVGGYVAHSIVQPLKIIVAAVARLARGEDVKVAGSDRQDEIGQLARSLDQVYQKGLEAARLRTAMDRCKTMVMIANMKRRHHLCQRHPAAVPAGARGGDPGRAAPVQRRGSGRRQLRCLPQESGA
jgi:methyl-accepting chemotaxis protein